MQSKLAELSLHPSVALKYTSIAYIDYALDQQLKSTSIGLHVSILHKVGLLMHQSVWKGMVGKLTSWFPVGLGQGQGFLAPSWRTWGPWGGGQPPLLQKLTAAAALAGLCTNTTHVHTPLFMMHRQQPLQRWLGSAQRQIHVHSPLFMQH